jgi:glutaminyl-peptide cyclotransferase
MLLDLLGAQEPKIPNYIPNTSTLFSELYHLEHALRRFGYWSGPITSPSYFQIKTHGNISDDQIPFLERDVRVVHIIPSPMPSSWHSVRDNKENLDWNTIDNLCRVVRLFVAKYIHISM